MQRAAGLPRLDDTGDHPVALVVSGRVEPPGLPIFRRIRRVAARGWMRLDGPASAVAANVCLFWPILYRHAPVAVRSVGLEDGILLVGNPKLV